MESFVPTNAETSVIPFTVTHETIQRSQKLVQKFKDALSQHGVPSIAKPWLERISGIKYCPSRTYICIVGSSGHGKSTTANAVIGEKVFIPTSDMRACTATCVEVAWNDREGKPYQAVVEFISPEEWRQDLELLVGDLESDRISIKDSDSPAGIAALKIKAVYPAVNVEELSTDDVDRLMEVHEVARILGKEKDFAADTALEVHNRLKAYVESRDSLLKAKVDRWPLIRKVRMYCPSWVLATGIVLVDLPGMEDSNAARVAVARRHLQQCSYVWVLTTIQRAESSKIAKNLTSEGFKQQMHLNGTIKRLTFICNMIDVGNEDNLRRDLCTVPGFVTEVTRIETELSKAMEEQARLARDIEALQRSLHDQEKQLKELRVEQKEYLGLRKAANQGRTVHPLQKNPEQALERHGNNEEASPSTPKRRKTDTSPTFKPDKLQSPLTLNEITIKLVELSEVHLEIDTTKTALEEELKDLGLKLKEVAHHIDQLKQRRWMTIIRFRNERCTAAIRQDFNAGVKDFYRHRDQDSDDWDSNDLPPAPDLSTFKLPVFCISAEGYNELAGQETERTYKYFATQEETGVPGLQKHARHLGNQNFRVDGQAFIEKVKWLLSSAEAWCEGGSSDITPNVDARSDKSTQQELVENLKQAICRHKGDFPGTTGDFHWNAELGGVFRGYINRHWPTHFDTTISNELDSAVEKLEFLADDLTKNFSDLMRAQERREHDIALATDAVSGFRSGLKDAIEDARRTINEGRLSVIDIPLDAFRPAMEEVYKSCALECGNGCFKKMRGRMATYMVEEAPRVFHKIRKEMDSQIENTLTRSQYPAIAAIDAACETVKRDLSTFGSKEASGFEALPADIRERLKALVHIGKKIMSPPNPARLLVIEPEDPGNTSDSWGQTGMDDPEDEDDAGDDKMMDRGLGGDSEDFE